MLTHLEEFSAIETVEKHLSNGSVQCVVVLIWINHLTITGASFQIVQPMRLCQLPLNKLRDMMDFIFPVPRGPIKADTDAEEVYKDQIFHYGGALGICNVFDLRSMVARPKPFHVVHIFHLHRKQAETFAKALGSFQSCDVYLHSGHPRAEHNWDQSPTHG